MRLSITRRADGFGVWDNMAAEAELNALLRQRGGVFTAEDGSLPLYQAKLD
jgi:hypothetical protein